MKGAGDDEKVRSEVGASANGRQSPAASLSVRPVVLKDLLCLHGTRLDQLGRFIGDEGGSARTRRKVEEGEQSWGLP